jgi:hypothetical protein
MSKEKLFEYYLSKNPLLLNDKITFSQSGLKKFFETTYDTAYKQGFNQEPASESEYEDDYELPQRPEYRTSGVHDLMKIFGMT